MKLFPPNYFAEETNFVDAYENAVKFCLKNGYKIDTEYNQTSLDMCATIVLSKHAIYQIKSRQLHNKFPTRDKHLIEYIRQFTPEFDTDVFEYTYFKRFTKYPIDDLFSLNQLENLKNNLKNSRRLQVISWIPIIDMSLEHPPCLQRIQLRVLQEPDFDNNIFSKGRIEVFLDWRSRDLFNAWQSNIIGIIFMIYNQILDNKYEIVKVVDFTTMMHIYEADWQQAGNI